MHFISIAVYFTASYIILVCLRILFYSKLLDCILGLNVIHACIF